jgi:hypothetical protein
VAQAIKTNLLLLQGEWWEDTSQGLPLFQSILAGPGTPDNLQAAHLLIRQRIAATQGVKSVDSIQVSFVNRQLSVSYSVTITGGESISGEVSL